MRKLFLIPLIVFALTAKAQVKTLTLKDAITYALENKRMPKKQSWKLKIANIKSRKFVQEPYHRFPLTGV